MGLVGPAMYADSAALIPELLEGLPFGVFATSSIDALVHAVESSLSPKATPYTKLFGYKAIEMIIRGYQKIVEDGKDAVSRFWRTSSLHPTTPVSPLVRRAVRRSTRLPIPLAESIMCPTARATMPCLPAC